jgi:branched-chain amino acid transport system substrate-binding protein
MSGSKNAFAGKNMRQAVQLYLDSVNKAGGINGKKIILDVFDDQNDPFKAKALEIVEENRALAVIGHNYSSASLSGGEVYKKSGIPAITPTSTDVKITTENEWYFRTIFDNQSQSQIFTKMPIMRQ